MSALPSCINCLRILWNPLLDYPLEIFSYPTFSFQVFDWDLSFTLIWPISQLQAQLTSRIQYNVPTCNIFVLLSHWNVTQNVAFLAGFNAIYWYHSQVDYFSDHPVPLMCLCPTAKCGSRIEQNVVLLQTPTKTIREDTKWWLAMTAVLARVISQSRLKVSAHYTALCHCFTFVSKELLQWPHTTFGRHRRSRHHCPYFR